MIEKKKVELKMLQKDFENLNKDYQSLVEEKENADFLLHPYKITSGSLVQTMTSAPSN